MGKSMRTIIPAVLALGLPVLAQAVEPELPCSVKSNRGVFRALYEGVAEAARAAGAGAATFGARTRKTAEHFVHRSFAPSGPIRSASTR